MLASCTNVEVIFTKFKRTFLTLSLIAFGSPLFSPDFRFRVQSWRGGPMARKNFFRQSLEVDDRPTRSQRKKCRNVRTGLSREARWPVSSMAGHRGVGRTRKATVYASIRSWCSAPSCQGPTWLSWPTTLSVQMLADAVALLKHVLARI